MQLLRQGHSQVSTVFSISLAPRPRQLSVACSMEKRERAWNILSREWRTG